MANAIIYKEVINHLGISTREFEQSLGLSNGSIKKAIDRNSSIKADTIDKILQIYPQVSRKFLYTGAGPVLATDAQDAASMLATGEEEANYTTGSELRNRKAFQPLPDEGLSFVPIKAQAGYTHSYSNPVFVNDLLKIYIPGNPYTGERYRAFEVEGDSMEYINPAGQPAGLIAGMIVIGEYVPPEDWAYTAQYYIYVIVTEDKIMIKRLFRKDDKYALISDNELYAQFVLTASEIKELWLVKRKIDWDMPPPRKIDITVDM
jgi:phage repressor protein C with HTH and peptisase S24 domain